MNLNSRVEGNRLIITADNAARRQLTEAYRDGGHQRLECALCDEGGMNGANGGLAMLSADLIPDAMTDMPLLAEWMHDDDGGISVWGVVYGFPDYCVRDPWGELRTTGRVEFEAVADYGPQGAKMPDRDSPEARAINSEAYDKLLEGWQPSYPPASPDGAHPAVG